MQVVSFSISIVALCGYRLQGGFCRMGTVNTLVITGYGTNSHLETAHAARLAGADRADVVHFSDIVAAKVRLSDYHFLVFPGGFLAGDDLGAAI